MNMNYASAVASKKNGNDILHSIYSQATLELRRELSKDEENLLSSKYSFELLSRQIDKVRIAVV